MSKIEVNTIEPQCGTTLTVGAAGTTVTVPSNVVKSNALQASDAGNIIKQCGTTVTLGATGDTIALASGASQTGFGRTGTVDWVTTPKVTGDSPITAVTGKGYFLNTTAGTITVNLPAGAAGSIVSMADYAATWQTNNVTVAPNGSEKMGGRASNATLNTEGQSVTFVYVDSTQGWINTMDSTSNVRAVAFVTATGGTPSSGAICGNCKVHTFTGPGTFCVSAISVTPACNQVSYIVVAGGGAGGTSQDGHQAGGGGAGGFREDKSPITPYTASPLDGAGNISVTASPYSIVAGGGGAASGSPLTKGANGADSSFSTITSSGGGGGGAGSNPGTCRPGSNGGSGGGSGGADQPPAPGGTGNTPPFSPSQGFPGGPGAPGSGAGASGGGATGCGARSPCAGTTHAGGAGATTEITASPVVYSEGGPTLASSSPGGGVAGPDNSGDGGQGSMNGGGTGNGGSGVVILRYKFQ